MVSKVAHKKKAASAGIGEKRARAQKLAREYNELARAYNEMAKKNWATAQKHTKAGEAAARRLVRQYNKLAAKGRQLERAVISYKNAKKKR